MGFTHNDKICGVNGVFIGAKGSEVQVSAKNSTLTYVFGAASTAEIVYNIVPWDATITNVYTIQQTTTQATVCTALVGSAGTQVASATFTSPGTAGIAQAGTVDSASLTAGQAIGVTRAASGTAGATTFALVITRTGS